MAEQPVAEVLLQRAADAGLEQIPGHLHRWAGDLLLDQGRIQGAQGKLQGEG